jgi:hypothetical protein
MVEPADENPFAVSELCTGRGDELAVVTDESWYCIEGDGILCGPVVQLPEVGIFTGALTDLAAVTVQAKFPFLKPVIRGRECTVKCFVERSVLRNRRAVNTVSVMSMLTGGGLAFGLIPTAFDFGRLGWAGLWALLVIAGAIGQFAATIRLFVAKYRHPHRHRIAGISSKAIIELARTAPRPIGMQ